MQILQTDILGCGTWHKNIIFVSLHQLQRIHLYSNLEGKLTY